MKKYLKHLIEHFRKLFKKEELELSFVNTPIQQNGWECGYHVMFYLFTICTKLWLDFETIQNYFDENRYGLFLHIISRMKENIYKSIQKEKETNESAHVVYCREYFLDSLNAFKNIM